MAGWLQGLMAAIDWLLEGKAAKRKASTTRRPLPRKPGPHTAQKPKQPAAATKSASPSAVMGVPKFEGEVLSAAGNTELGAYVIDASREVCALFDNGRWLVAENYKGSPLATSVWKLAKRFNLEVNDPEFVDPSVIKAAYRYAAESAPSARDDSSTYKRIIEKDFEYAAKLNASDVHYEVLESQTLVQFCIDGDLYEIRRSLVEEGRRIVGVIFNNAKMQSGVTSNPRASQSAMLEAKSEDPTAIRMPDGVTGARCEWMKTVEGRYLAIRLHYSQEKLMGTGSAVRPPLPAPTTWSRPQTDDFNLIKMGFSAAQERNFKQSWRTPGGVRIVAAPTNEGKTTTLRAVLNNRLTEMTGPYGVRRNCLMIEDPTEGGVVGARRIGISAAHGDEEREGAFTETLRSVLRVAPDIIFLGEIRDDESARFCFRLGMIGRQIYTTLHVHSALAIPQRLMDIGIEKYLVCDPKLLELLCSQRLVRCLCGACRMSLNDAVLRRPELRPLYERVIVAVANMKQRLMERQAFGRMSDLPAMTLPDLAKVCISSGRTCSGVEKVRANGETISQPCANGQFGRAVVAEVIPTDRKLLKFLGDGDVEAAEEYWLAADGLNGMPMLWNAIEKMLEGTFSPESVEEVFGPLASEADVAAFFITNEHLREELNAFYEIQPMDMEAA